jgi:hypothetical protein
MQTKKAAKHRRVSEQAHGKRNSTARELGIR